MVKHTQLGSSVEFPFWFLPLTGKWAVCRERNKVLKAISTNEKRSCAHRKKSDMICSREKAMEQGLESKLRLCRSSEWDQPCGPHEVTHVS